MATAVPYSEGVTSVAPNPTPPDDYQRINASPESFGASIGRGIEQFGQGAAKAADVFGHAAVDDASNKFQEFTTKLLHGDPSAPTTGPDGLPVLGPDGKPIPDTGYLGTQGRSALDRRPHVDKALDDQMQEIRKGLPTPAAQEQFDNIARRYKTSVMERVGSHADSQAKTWYSSVNTSTAKLAMEHIANNYDSPTEVLNGAADLTAAYVKNAQLQGATPDSPQMKEAMQAARRDALDAQLNAMAVKDPSRALAVLDKNREIAGIKYDDMAAKFRARAKQQQGYDIAEQAIKKTYVAQPAQPTYQPATLTAAGAPYGVSGSYLQRVQQLETGSNPNQTSETGAQGPFQFTKGTAKQYKLDDPFNYEKAADAAARFAADNKAALTRSLGRVPTDAEVYLAHQQGSGGAALLLANPTARAGDLVGDRAIRVNGGDPNAPASQFTSMWAAKFIGAPGQAYSQRKAVAFQEILADPNLDPEVRQHALQHVDQQMRAAQVAEEQDAKAVKAKNDQMQSDLVRKIISGTSPGIIGEIANSGLPANEMENLYRFATNEGGIQDDMRYGPGYAAAFRQVLSSPDDPSHISSPADLIARGGPGGDLTKKGVTELMGVMDKIKKQPDQAGVATVKSKQLDYYLDQFAIDQNSPLAGIPGVKPQRNQKGVDKFNHEFVPAFEAAYSQWIAAGKDPMAFLTDNKQIDAIANRVYPLSERAADAIKANPGEQKPPPAPEGVPQGAWDKIVAAPPKLKDGSMVPLDKWGKVLEWLRNNPTPENMAAFDAKMGPSGYTADFVLKRLPPEKSAAPATAAPAPAPAPPEPEPVGAGATQGKGPTYD